MIMDLPGIYSLSPYTLEEVVARNYLIGERPDAIINIIDGTNIERNLYLSTQLMELGIPVIMAVNMIDILEKSGDTIRISKLAEKLGCEVVEISALKGTGVKSWRKKLSFWRRKNRRQNRYTALARKWRTSSKMCLLYLAAKFRKNRRGFLPLSFWKEMIRLARSFPPCRMFPHN